MPQTPIQRRANEKYARKEELKKGKPASSHTKKERSPISKPWLCMYIYSSTCINQLLHLLTSQPSLPRLPSHGRCPL